MSLKLFTMTALVVVAALLAGCASGPNYSAAAIKNGNTGAESTSLAREKTPADVVNQHLNALNACDWGGLLAQFPDEVEIHLPGGAIVEGRQAVGDLFAGFVLPPEDGGLCGITFSEESRKVVNGTLVVQWVANAEFLGEPYRGSDAYVTDDGLMVSMVTTFDGAELKMKDSQ